MKYVKIFPFQVMDKVMEGKDVNMLDRLDCEVDNVCIMSVGTLAAVISAKNEADRYEFWYVEEEVDAEL
jgi:hypothetical protein